MMNLAEFRRDANRLADYLPWAALAAPGVVLNKDGSFQRTARFRGPDLDSAVAAELVAVASRINNAFRRLGSGWSIFVEAQRHEAATYPDSQFPDPASGLVDAERKPTSRRTASTSYRATSSPSSTCRRPRMRRGRRPGSTRDANSPAWILMRSCERLSTARIAFSLFSTASCRNASGSTIPRR